MPNWCANSLVLRHEDVNMIERAVQSFQKEEFCNEFVPMPEEFKNDGWYEWRVSNWGTKWDVGSSQYGVERGNANECKFSFDSAWSPPIQFYEKLEELGFTVKAMYYESGMAFCGIYEDGFDDYYEYGDLDSDGVANTIPQELDEYFCISEQLADWEDEQEDEEDQENLDIDLDDGLSATNEGHEEEENE